MCALSVIMIKLKIVANYFYFFLILKKLPFILKYNNFCYPSSLSSCLQNEAESISCTVLFVESFSQSRQSDRIWCSSINPPSTNTAKFRFDTKWLEDFLDGKFNLFSDEREQLTRSYNVKIPTTMMQRPLYFIPNLNVQNLCTSLLSLRIVNQISQKVGYYEVISI